MYEWLLGIEFAILDFIYGLHCAAADAAMVFITHLGDRGMIWILIGLLLLIKKESRKAGVCVLLALLLSLLVTNLTVKPLVQRMRPFEIKEGIELLIKAPQDFSFPSGHTSSSFAAATAVFLSKRRLGAVMYMLAVLIAFSRLYLYVHFPTDVLCAALIGVGAGFASVCIYDKMLKRYI